MIVATAGHIDHGKTVLVKALTGIDTDRLPEEKRRGISIDLGYAYHELPDGGVLGFVDVPGHERFVRNMLAGVTGIDFALLIVAADDGPMPQTVEHLAILDLLGLSRGAVAVTKIDRVAPERVDEAIDEIAALTAETGLAGAPVFPLSGLTGDGVPALRDHLEAAARDFADGGARGHFRLAVDRSFIVPGAGLVVTGTVFSGAVGVNDRLVLSPEGIRVRVRGIHAQNRKAETGGIGQRCALNITGPDLEKDRIHRGDWVLAEPVHAPTTRIDARIRVLAGEDEPLKHWTPVHLHLGAADVTGRVAVLGERQIATGADALVQLHLSGPVGALRGDRLILRDQSARRTIAGGAVIDPFPPRRGRARPERLAALTAMEHDDPAESLARLLDLSPGGVDLDRFARSRNLTPEEAEELFARVPMHMFRGGEGRMGVAPPRWTVLRGATVEALKSWHGEKPDQTGVAEPALRRTLAEPVPAPLFAAVIADLAAKGEVINRGRVLRLPQHQAAMAPQDAAMWARVGPLVEGKILQPPAIHDIAKTLGMAPDQVARFLRRAAGMGLVVRVADNRYFSPDAVMELSEIAEALALEATEGLITAAAFRDESGIGRNLAIQVLEFFDKAGLTRRIGDARKVMKPAAEVFGH